MRTFRLITGLALLLSGAFLFSSSVQAQEANFFLQELVVIDANGDERNVDIKGSNGIDIDIEGLDPSSLLEMQIVLNEAFGNTGNIVIAESLEQLESVTPVLIDDVREDFIVPIRSLTSSPNMFLRLFNDSGVEEFHRLNLVSSPPVGLTGGFTGTSAAGAAAGGFSDGCPVEQCPEPYEFGSAYFSSIGGILTHPEHDGPHFFYEEGRIALGVRKFLANGVLDPAVDPDYHGYDDATVTRDQDGMALSTNALNTAPFSTRSLFQIETQHIAGPSCDPVNPITCRLGTLITARYEKTGEPHQYSFKVLNVLDVRSEGRQQIAVNPLEFSSEGWVRFLYFDYDIDTISMDPTKTRAELMSWDGAHSSLSSILGWAPETIPGEIEDYQYQVSCDGELDIYTPGSIPFAKLPPCSAGTSGTGSTSGQVSSGAASGTTGTTTGGSTTGGSSTIQNSCGFNGSTLTIICNASGVLSLPGQPFGPPIITVINDLYTSFKAFQPNQITAETRLTLIYRYLMVLLPTL